MVTSKVAGGRRADRRPLRGGAGRSGTAFLIYVLPALTVYVAFSIWPALNTLYYSFLDWDGLNPAEWIGPANYVAVFTDRQLFESIVHSLVLVIFFSVLPICLGLLPHLPAQLRQRYHPRSDQRMTISRHSFQAASSASTAQ